ncbi:response regulator transcription factor [Marinobacter halodurans]|uniref:Response regulator transcription factor n=1 Tax=Marinobacter halodurans TaxID=2528979 RepID=A0ABY1ZNT1_9GAMM|nr:response regulator transcription factor [Marinobacter halodurans]TBW55434.1 response regulator transcription factor [Marinobacter halodurans]
MIDVLIADDHTLMRECLKRLFDGTDDIRVKAEASNGGEVLEALRRVAFDVVMLDVSMPGLSGESLVARIHDRYPELPILILTMFNETQIAKRKLKAGASGYLTKDCEPDMLVGAIRKLAAGGRAIHPELAERIAFDLEVTGNRTSPGDLTRRERQILHLLAKGLTLNEIADQLAISNKTVSTHKTRLMKKAGINNNAELVTYAMRHRMIE